MASLVNSCLLVVCPCTKVFELRTNQLVWFVQIHVSSWCLSLFLFPIPELQHTPLPPKCYEPRSVPQLLLLPLSSSLDSQLSPSRSLEMHHHFMDFIFHKIDRTCFHIQITTQWKAKKRFTCRNLYVYPNFDEIMLLKCKIKSVFTKNRYFSPYQIIELINPILHGWGNYFGIGNFLHMFTLLNHWIWHRSWWYLHPKFLKTLCPILVSRFY